MSPLSAVPDEIHDLNALGRQCMRLGRETGDLYHLAVRADLPDALLKDAARLAGDIAALHNRIVIALAARLEEQP